MDGCYACTCGFKLCKAVRVTLAPEKTWSVVTRLGQRIVMETGRNLYQSLKAVNKIFRKAWTPRREPFPCWSAHVFTREPSTLQLSSAAGNTPPRVQSLCPRV